LARNSALYRERNFSVVYKRECDNRDRRREDILKYSRLRYKTHKDTLLRNSKKWRLSNRAKEAARTARRKAALLRACPAWVDHDQIEEFYAMARSLTEKTGVPHEVDHIHPLQGEALCGLHVPWNLQILTKSENSRKKNKFIDAALSEKP
jgi:5-methylcytosine-specific restriction endonuclease McrA